MNLSGSQFRFRRWEKSRCFIIVIISALGHPVQLPCKTVSRRVVRAALGSRGDASRSACRRGLLMATSRLIFSTSCSRYIIRVGRFAAQSLHRAATLCVHCTTPGGEPSLSPSHCALPRVTAPLHTHPRIYHRPESRVEMTSSEQLIVVILRHAENFIALIAQYCMDYRQCFS